MSSKRIKYGVHPGVEMTMKWVATLEEKTGRSLDEWLTLIVREGPSTEAERREWLKHNHELGTNSASWLAQRSVGKGTEADNPDAYLRAAEDYVDQMFSGKKAALKPLFEELLELGYLLGNDVKACPCQTIVPFYRHHVFAQVKASTNTRLDLGLALGNVKTPKRLLDTGGFAKKDRITRRIEITARKDIDAEVRRWLTTAYDLDQ